MTGTFAGPETTTGRVCNGPSSVRGREPSHFFIVQTKNIHQHDLSQALQLADRDSLEIAAPRSRKREDIQSVLRGIQVSCRTFANMSYGQSPNR